jgi:hypothetical protein
MELELGGRVHLVSNNEGGASCCGLAITYVFLTSRPKIPFALRASSTIYVMHVGPICPVTRNDSVCCRLGFCYFECPMSREHPKIIERRITE